MFQNNFEHRTHPIPTIDLKFALLEKLYSAPSHTADRYQLTNEFPDLINPTHDAITELIGKGYVETIIGSNDIRLTLSGIDAYESEYQRRKERRRNTFIIPFISSTVNSALTFLIEHFTKLISKIKALL